MPFESGLNILWVCLALACLGVFVWAEVSRDARSTFAARARRAFAVLFALIFLFPCVSESDDRLTLQNLQFTLETRGEVGNPLPQKSSDEKPGLHLARFFEALQSFRIAALYAILLTLLCVSFVMPAAALRREFHLPSAPGRAPPLPSGS